MPRLTSKGQITIPAEVREKLGLVPGSVIEFDVFGQAALMREAGQPTTKGQRTVAALRGSGGFDAGMTTDEYMYLLRGDD